MEDVSSLGLLLDDGHYSIVQELELSVYTIGGQVLFFLPRPPPQLLV